MNGRIHNTSQSVAEDRARVAGSTPSRLLSPRFVRVLVAQTIFSLGWSLYLLLPKYFAVVLHADPITVGNLNAMSGLSSVVTIPLAARGIDRLGAKLFFGAGCGALVLLSLGFMCVHDLGPAMYVLNGLHGAAFILTFNAGATLATDDVAPERIGQALGVFGASNLVMNGVSTLIGEKLALLAGWDSVFALGLAAPLLAFAFAARQPNVTAPRVRTSAAPPATVSLRALSPVLITSALLGGAFTAMFVLSQPYALQRGAREVNDYFLGFTVAAVITRACFGNLGDRFGRVRVSLCAIALYTLAAASMCALQPRWLVVHGAVLGFAHGVVYPTLNAVLMERVGLHQRGRAMALYTGAFMLGSTVLGALWGQLAKRCGYPAVYLGAALVCLCAFGCLLRPAPGAHASPQR